MSEARSAEITGSERFVGVPGRRCVVGWTAIRSSRCVVLWPADHAGAGRLNVPGRTADNS